MKLKNINYIDLIKFCLAIMLIICLLDMPYSYYQIVRLSALIVFSILAYRSFHSKKNEIGILYTGLALLFQPFFKIILTRGYWQVIDILVSIFLLLSIFFHKSRNNSSNENN